jgi:hypothetical protein
MFLAQQLRDGDTAHMLIWSDDGLLDTQQGRQDRLSWEVVGTQDWIPLTRKYAPMLDHARAHQPPVDAWAVWDDDDAYMPWHLAAHAEALLFNGWSHPSRAYSTYGGLHERQLSGRHYHGALAVSEPLMKSLGGWPETDRSDYDKHMLARCRQLAGVPADPCLFGPPSYAYRWTDTGRDHCSGRSQIGPDGIRRYRQPRIQEPRLGIITPKLSKDTAAVLAAITRQASPSPLASPGRQPSGS